MPFPKTPSYTGSQLHHLSQNHLNTLDLYEALSRYHSSPPGLVTSNDGLFHQLSRCEFEFSSLMSYEMLERRHGETDETYLGIFQKYARQWFQRYCLLIGYESFGAPQKSVGVRRASR